MRSKSNYTHCSLSGTELSFNTGTLLKQMIEAIQQFMSCEKGEIDTDLIYLFFDEKFIGDSSQRIL